MRLRANSSGRSVGGSHVLVAVLLSFVTVLVPLRSAAVLAASSTRISDRVRDGYATPRSAMPAGLYSCGEIPFHASALRDPRGYERRNTPEARALRGFLRVNADLVFQPRHGWFVLGRRGDRIQFASGRRAPYGSMTFQRIRHRWVWENSGGCDPRAYRHGLEASLWYPAPGAPRPTPATTRIPVLVQEDNCASGRDARGRVLPPTVRYTTTAVLVTYFIRPLAGDQTCQGVPPTPVTLSLPHPLGNRHLLDGATLPPSSPAS
ncbi:MAG: hypothetical protein M3Z27_08815 [Actinomycetota bacterium]|nr:hypothetical protein [Actinomycetota bacterium]